MAAVQCDAEQEEEEGRAGVQCDALTLLGS